MVGWSTDKSVVDAIEVVDKEGNSWLLTAVTFRDELFNRLMLMGGKVCYWRFAFCVRDFCFMFVCIRLQSYHG